MNKFKKPMSVRVTANTDLDKLTIEIGVQDKDYELIIADCKDPNHVIARETLDPAVIGKMDQFLFYLQIQMGKIAMQQDQSKSRLNRDKGEAVIIDYDAKDKIEGLDIV